MRHSCEKNRAERQHANVLAFIFMAEKGLVLGTRCPISFFVCGLSSYNVWDSFDDGVPCDGGSDISFLNG